MKKDLDALMEKAGLDALLISGSATHNPAMYYFTGNVHVSQGDLIKLRGQEPVLFCNSMEREEAARSGLATKNLAEYRYPELLKQTGGDPAQATALRYQKMFADIGLTKGTLSIYGKMEAGQSFAVFNALQALLPDIEILGETQDPVLMLARETKDANELEHTRKMGAVTVEIVSRTAAFLQSHKAKEGVLINEAGNPLTIGDVKRKINQWAIELGVENPHGVIFAIGRDAGVPHSTGNPEDVLELGKTIVFDIFLQEPGGGYHFDFTRTWCLGFASEEVQALYEDVREVFDKLMNEEMKANMGLKTLQDRTCDLFEEQGHETIRQNPLIEEGYVHSIGHGLGLDVHELPFVRPPEGVLKPGVIVTIEPGLYYPSRGMGCRLEDTVFVHADGQIEVLADYPHDLVLEIEIN
ncbi:MAG: aminopeptidase P family protein [Anaerolineales bacterium]|nr:aminopeptidase P family protein [Anaerolineales bacterium]